MKVGSSRNGQSQVCGHSAVPGFRRGIVIAVTRFDGGQPVVGKACNTVVDVRQSGMCERRDAARRREDLDYPRDRRSPPGNERGAPGAQQPIECVPAIGGVPGLDQRIGHLRPPDAPVRMPPRPRDEQVQRHGQPQRPQSLADLDDTPEAIGPLRLEKRSQPVAAGVEEVAEHVNVPALLDGGDLDAAHKRDAGGFRGAASLGQAGRRVVIGDADRAESGGGGEGDEPGGRETSVRRRGVEVEIDQRSD